MKPFTFASGCSRT